MSFLQPQRSRREIRLAVLKALSPQDWRTAADVARTTRLPLDQVRRCLHRLAAEHLAIGCVETESPWRLNPSGSATRMGHPAPILKSPRAREVAHA